VKSSRVCIPLLLIFITVWSFTACDRQNLTAERPEIKQQQPIPTKKTLLGPKDFREAVITVARDNIPAVVHIEVSQRQEIDNPFTPFGNEPFFRRFFDIPRTQKKFRRELKGIGTGMIINSSGYILTNYHVVAGATEIQVILSNEGEYPAKINRH
jgi:S1-C subfamily serine protease